MSGEEARQLIRRKEEINGGNDEQDDAEQGQYQLHGRFLLDKACGEENFAEATSEVRFSRPVYRLLQTPRKGGLDGILGSPLKN
jgi:hypothetical protein